LPFAGSAAINRSLTVLNVNEYFDGNVKSIGFQGPRLPASVGVMSAGQYEFGTSQKETMTVISGILKVLLPGETAWKDFGKGESFIVDANQKFQLEVAADVAYLCTYEEV